MRVNQLTVGTALSGGRVIVTGLKRDGVYTHVQLTSGPIVRTFRLHKTQPIATVLVMIGAATGTGSFTTTPHKVRVSDPQWRGQSQDVRPSWEDSRGGRKGRTTVPTDAPAVRTDARY